MLSRIVCLLNVVFPTQFLMVFTDATDCSDIQMQRCKDAALGNSLDTLAGGGQCQAKPYVQFSHLCKVNNYLPNVEFCCCAFEEKVMCCRYHHIWDVFRCTAANDIVYTIASPVLSQELLLTAILVPVAAVLCCAMCCIKYMCCRDDDEEAPCGCVRIKGHRQHQRATAETVLDNELGANCPLTEKKPPMSFHKHSGKCHGNSLQNGNAMLVPSAPLLEDLDAERSGYSVPSTKGSDSFPGCGIVRPPRHTLQTIPRSALLILSPERDPYQRASGAFMSKPRKLSDDVASGGHPEDEDDYLDCRPLSLQGILTSDNALQGILTNEHAHIAMLPKVGIPEEEPPPYEDYDDVDEDIHDDDKMRHGEKSDYEHADLHIGHNGVYKCADEGLQPYFHGDHVSAHDDTEHETHNHDNHMNAYDDSESHSYYHDDHTHDDTEPTSFFHDDHMNTYDTEPHSFFNDDHMNTFNDTEPDSCFHDDPMSTFACNDDDTRHFDYDD